MFIAATDSHTWSILWSILQTRLLVSHQPYSPGLLVSHQPYSPDLLPCNSGPPTTTHTHKQLMLSENLQGPSTPQIKPCRLWFGKSGLTDWQNVWWISGIVSKCWHDQLASRSLQSGVILKTLIWLLIMNTTYKIMLLQNQRNIMLNTTMKHGKKHFSLCVHQQLFKY